jgi:hypothetical protein
MRKTAIAVALVATFTLAGSAAAGADMLTPNLVQNPGGEAGVAALGGIVPTIPSWLRNPLFGAQNTTVVSYGVPGFLTAAQGAGYDAGNQFFAGGPAFAGDDNSVAHAESELGQEITIPAEVVNLVKSGGAQVTFGACLGGYADQNDHVNLNFFTNGLGLADVIYADQTTIVGPGAQARGNVTSLMPVSRTMMLPPTSTKLGVRLDFLRNSGADTYNDGYADNVSVIIGTAGTTPPPIHCAPDAVAGPSAPPQSGGSQGSASTSTGGSNSAVPLVKVSKRVVISFRRRTAKLRLRCAARDSACQGTLSLTSSLGRLGAITRFRIAAGNSASVTVKLGPTTRRRLAALSHKRFAKLKITATATIGAERTKFTFTASH